jgi:hypothetical protein
MQVIKPNWFTNAQEEDMSDTDPEDAIAAIDTMIQQRLAPVCQSIDRLYALLRNLHPEKRFMQAVEAVNKEAQEAQRPKADPRFDELSQEVQSLKEGLPKVIAETMKGLIGDLTTMVKSELATAQASNVQHQTPDDELEDGVHEE